MRTRDYSMDKVQRMGTGSIYTEDRQGGCALGNVNKLYASSKGRIFICFRPLCGGQRSGTSCEDIFCARESSLLLCCAVLWWSTARRLCSIACSLGKHGAIQSLDHFLVVFIICKHHALHNSSGHSELLIKLRRGFWQ